MATIDKTVYVALPELLGNKKNELYYYDLHQALKEEAETATSITILGGYMSPGFVLELCKNVPKRGSGGRGRFALRIAIGVEPTRPLAQQWEALRSLESNLRSAGFGSVEVKAVLYGKIHFHTKLFGFDREAEQSWYVGSANPSGSPRHELMVRVGRKHAAIAAYAEAVLKVAKDVTGEVPTEEQDTLPLFFLSGFLAHKPPNSRLFTFDAFRFTSAERAQLDVNSGERAGLRHANPTTEGYGFNLGSALGEAALDDAVTAKKVRHTGYSVDTVFGFWMPRPYAEKLKQNYKNEEKQREGQLERFATRLCSKQGGKDAQMAFKDYLEDMAKFLQQRSMAKHPVQGCDELFLKFITSRIRFLEDAERRSRQARIMVIQEMPDIWSDERASRAFETSFFEDIRSRALSGSRRSRVISALLDGLGDADTAGLVDVRDALERRLRGRPWTDEDWR